MEVFQIGRSTDECIADFHYRLEVEAFFAFWFRHESDIDLSGIQHVEGLVGGLAGDCNTDLRIGSYEIFQPGHKYIFA